MSPLVRAYRRRLNLLSALWLAASSVLVIALGWGTVNRLDLALALWGVLTLSALFRAGSDGHLPGTHPLHPRQAPGLFTLVEGLARRAGLHRLPEVRIVPGGQTNAAATLRGSTPVLVITEALLARLDARRLEAVLAHETAHLAHGDLVLFRLALSYQTASWVLAVLVVFLGLVWPYHHLGVGLFWLGIAAAAPTLARLVTASLSRTREFAADLGAARLTGDPGALADALELIEYRPRTFWDWVWGRRSPVPLDPAGQAFRTHPPTTERVRRLDLLARRW